MQIPHMNGVAKVDLWEQDPVKAVAGELRFETPWIGGEAFFVPASEDGAACNGESLQAPMRRLLACC